MVSPLRISNYLTFAVKTTTPGMDLYPYLKKANGEMVFPGIAVSSYVYGDINNEWKVVWIPLRDLTANLGNIDISDIYFEFNSAGTVWLDEVKMVEELRWPLPEVSVVNCNEWRLCAWRQG